VHDISSGSKNPDPATTACDAQENRSRGFGVGNSFSNSFSPWLLYILYHMFGCWETVTEPGDLKIFYVWCDVLMVLLYWHGFSSSHLYLMSKFKFFYLFVSFVKISFGLIYERFRLIFQFMLLLGAGNWLIISPQRLHRLKLYEP